MADRIFLSHSVADKQLVEKFETLMKSVLNVRSDDIFVSSLEGQGAPKGGPFVDDIREELVSSKGVIALITPSYLDSAFCMAELGAAWALQSHRLPVIVPPNDFKVMEATLLGIVGVMIDDALAMTQAFEEFSEKIGIRPPSAAIRGRAMRSFQADWSALKDSIAPSKRVERAIHEEAISARDAAIEERDAAEADLRELEEKYATVSDLKNREDVEEVEREYKDFDAEEALDELLSELQGIHSDLGGKQITRLLILAALGKTKRPDHEDADRAIELDVYDADTMTWNFRHEDVKRLMKIVKEVQELFIEYPELEKELKRQGQKSDPETIRFWEENL